MSEPRTGGLGAAIEPRLHEFPALAPHGFVRIAYTEWGPADAQQTVLCVHGLTRNGRDFDFLARHLAARGLRVVAPDLPGRGRSEWFAHAEDYGSSTYVALMAALIARLGAARVDWVGTSLGAHIGMELAALPGSPIRRLLMNDFGARVHAAGLQRISGYLRTYRRFATLADLEAHMRRAYATFGALTDAQWRHLAEHSAVPAEDGQVRPHYDPAIAKQFAWPIMLDIVVWRAWDQVTCPVLILRGESSDLLLRATVREMERRGVAARRGLVRAVEIPDCGHAPALMSEQQIGLVEEFLLAPEIGAARTDAPVGRGALA